MRALLAGITGVGVFLAVISWWSGPPDMGIWIAAVSMFIGAWVAGKVFERLL